MALEAGGYAEKLGNRYEANWVAYQLLQLLNEKILSVTVEPLGDDEVGVDVIIERHNGEKEYHQCKVGNANSEYWTLSQLNQSQILQNALFQIKRGVGEFHLVSPLTAKNLSDLTDSSLNSSGDINEFYKYQLQSSQKREKLFNDLCKLLKLDNSIKPDQQQALLFLQRFKVTQYVINKYTTCELEDKATSLFSGHPFDILNFLKNYPVEFDKLRVKITAPLLLDDLGKHGFIPRIKPDDKRISPVLDRISTDFENSIKPYLISDSLIPRSEANTVMGSIENNAVTLIKAESGMGKSALLLELHEKITLQGTISVPIRLDRNRPENNVDEFGKKLGFPYSPVLSLSRFTGNKKTVFILDQLDAIRWTATHSNNALQVCQELVRQILNLRKEEIDVSVILACRDFDLDEDVALSSWINDLGDEVQEVSVSSLNPKMVIQHIECYEDFDSLSDEKKNILTIPLWLSIYLTIAKRINAAPQFSNKLELVKRFWDDRIAEVASLGISEESSKRLIDEIVVLMNSKSRLSIHENVISISSPKTLKALLSVGILSMQSQYISFRHQALFDYQVGISLFNAARRSPDQLIIEIGGFSQQILTKREHLKYALNMLLDYDQSVFCANALAILTSDRIRYHLKYLVFNLIKELTTLKNSAKKMMENIAGNPDLLSNFISISCYNNLHIVNSLSDSGIISSWLNSEDDEKIEKSIRILRSVADKSPNTVLKELTPFIGKSEDWNNKVYAGLCWDMDNDSDEMFSIRKKLINKGCNAGFIQWKKLAKNTPSRALDLIVMILYHYNEILKAPKYNIQTKIDKLTDRDSFTESELEELNDITFTIPAEVIEKMLAVIHDIDNKEINEVAAYNWLNEEYYSSYETEDVLRKSVLSIIDNAAKNLSNESEKLLDLITIYLSSKSPVIMYLMANVLIHLSINYSDLVIKWLIKYPNLRLNCGNTYVEPEWVLPGKLIEKFSGHCSDDLFCKLENTIYYFNTCRSVDNIQHILKDRRKGRYYNYWGEAQYFLLPMLNETRAADHTKQLINVLNRTFETYKEADFSSAIKSTGGFVTSPLPVGNVLSDKAWKKLILSPMERSNKGAWIQRGRDSISESSIEQFSRSLDSAVKNQPKRFAQLALSLPSNIDKLYINSFYDGLMETDKNKINEDYREEWELCSPDLTEKVINHFENIDFERSLVRLLETRISEKGWSKQAVQLLIDFATNADDPHINSLNIRDIKKSEYAKDADVESLLSNALNCTRGIAYRGISRLFWDNEELAIEFKYLIQSAIDDPHPAVNIVALDMLLPMMNYDINFAKNKFISLCNKDLRMTCGHNTHYFFNGGFEDFYKNDFIKIVLNMIESPFEKVKKEAARQVFARWFFNDLFQDEVIELMKCEENVRQGIASVMAQILSEDKHQHYLHKLPPIYAQLVNDDSKNVLKTIGSCVRHANYWNKTISNDLFNIFVSSKAALHCMYELFDAIEKHSGNLLEYKQQLLLLVDNITSSNNPDSSIRGMHIRESSLINVLQRLYDEAIEDEDDSAINICLDIWDKLLKSEIYSAINASKELENGLLS